MKKVNILIVILTIALVAVSCETYDDYNTDRTTVVGFTTATKNINNIPEGGTKSETVNLFVSDLSSADRTYTVIQVPLDSMETASENYTYDATVTFPANTREASIVVTAIDNSITDERNFFKLAIQGGPDVVSGGLVLVGVKN
ncbi:hypothetical protein A7A78_07500 [Aequorivita soesokkakensis]|jgi:hypothetical protein|uniref:Calx-beta domain-containing protein n=1 Tax=Aequorivita soesokkakensis TaxID=1385699 RepID=A0A1A9LAR7_9FLAO|nr:hypothetical protein [Aequorivita soesokkakensis]OAD90054.1 hypothetical protein A7A78_07500 [Aequorivita soesokkakensis]